MRNNQTYTVAAALVAMAMLGTSFFNVSAQCGWAYGEMNSATGGQMNVAGTLEDGSGTGTIVTKFWMLGKSAEHNSGSLPTIYQSFPWEARSYYVWSNWGDSGIFGDCAERTDKSLFVYSIQNGGAGQYILLVAPYNEAYMAWDFDSITNGNGPLGPNTETPIAIPALNVASQSATGDVATLGLTWSPIANLKGFYDVDPGTNMITGVAIRFFQSATAPTSFKTSDWPVVGTVAFGANGTDPGQASVQVPDAPGLNTYVALTVLFDNGQPGGFTETAFVGAPTLVPSNLPPADKFSFKSVSATPQMLRNTTLVAWTAAGETSVKFYQVWGSNNVKGQFRPLSSTITPSKGSYSVLCSSQLINYFQVRATMADGSVVASDIVKATK